ncbi:MAG: hypothetical protein ACRYGM_24225 [Janthinobacterium lividum]
MKHSSPLVLALALAPIVAAAWTGSAHAQANPAGLQTPGASTSGGTAGSMGGRGGNRAPRDPAPPALPGARAEPDAVAPASKVAVDMPPTEALFDSINRGDLAGAKDAIGRGADINGTNVLGLTPLELAVDLGRNQISFLLLSLRGGAGYSTASGPVGPKPAPKPLSRAERVAAERAERASQAPRRTAVEGPPPPPQTARLFSGNGGAAVPQAGFLGFDANR